MAPNFVPLGTAGALLERFGVAVPELATKYGKYLPDVLRGTGCGCFPVGTVIARLGGSTSIERLRAGDLVLAEDPATGRVEPERVQAVIDDGTKPTMRLDPSDGSGLQVTTNHPFYVDGGPGTAAPG